jgi:hypothetical protein
VSSFLAELNPLAKFPENRTLPSQSSFQTFFLRYEMKQKATNICSLDFATLILSSWVSLARQKRG